MPNDFPGLFIKPGESAGLYKVEDTTPPPKTPMPPKPPEGWDKKTGKPSYTMARAARKSNAN